MQHLCINTLQPAGSDRVIDVIDVTRQADLRMTLGEFVEYYTNPLRPKVYNVISLEFTDTRYHLGYLWLNDI